MKSFILHLERAKDREPRVDYLSHLLPGDVEVVNAVDGQALTSIELAAFNRNLHRPRYPFALRHSEIACFHSHRKVWKMIVDSSDDFALVAEDDIMLDTAVFAKSYALAVDKMTADSFIRFPVANRENPLRTVSSNDENSLFIPKFIGLGMHLQLIGRTYASRLLEATERFDRPVDTLLQMHWVTKSVPMTILPSGVAEMDADIGGSSISEGKSFLQTLRREIARPIYRIAINMRAVD